MTDRKDSSEDQSVEKKTSVPKYIDTFPKSSKGAGYRSSSAPPENQFNEEGESNLFPSITIIEGQSTPVLRESNKEDFTLDPAYRAYYENQKRMNPRLPKPKGKEWSYQGGVSPEKWKNANKKWNATEGSQNEVQQGEGQSNQVQQQFPRTGSGEKKESNPENVRIDEEEVAAKSKDILSSVLEEEEGSTQPTSFSTTTKGSKEYYPSKFGGVPKKEGVGFTTSSGLYVPPDPNKSFQTNNFPYGSGGGSGGGGGGGGKNPQISGRKNLNEIFSASTTPVSLIHPTTQQQMGVPQQQQPYPPQQQLVQPQAQQQQPHVPIQQQQPGMVVQPTQPKSQYYAPNTTQQQFQPQGQPQGQVQPQQQLKTGFAPISHHGLNAPPQQQTQAQPQPQGQVQVQPQPQVQGQVQPQQQQPQQYTVAPSRPQILFAGRGRTTQVQVQPHSQQYGQRGGWQQTQNQQFVRPVQQNQQQFVRPVQQPPQYSGGVGTYTRPTQQQQYGRGTYMNTNVNYVNSRGLQVSQTQQQQKVYGGQQQQYGHSHYPQQQPQQQQYQRQGQQQQQQTYNTYGQPTQPTFGSQGGRGGRGISQVQVSRGGRGIGYGNPQLSPQQQRYGYSQPQRIPNMNYSHGQNYQGGGGGGGFQQQTRSGNFVSQQQQGNQGPYGRGGVSNQQQQQQQQSYGRSNNSHLLRSNSGNGMGGGGGARHKFSGGGTQHHSQTSRRYPRPNQPSRKLYQPPGSGFGSHGLRKKEKLLSKPDPMERRTLSSGAEALLERIRKDNRTKEMHVRLEDIIGHVAELAMDQVGSRFIQKQIELRHAFLYKGKPSPDGSGGDGVMGQVFRCMEDRVVELMEDVFGNYVIQKFFEYGTEKQMLKLVKAFKGLSVQTYGCRVVQKALEVVKSEEGRKVMVEELGSVVLKLVDDQNGNHVVQKCVECLSPEHVGFVLKAFEGKVVEQSMHSYGCRVIQRIIEFCSEEQKVPMLQEIHDGLGSLIRDQYGNYVVQHVLKHRSALPYLSVNNGGVYHNNYNRKKKREEVVTESSQKAKALSESIITKMIGVIATNVVDYSSNKFASNVIEKCFQFCKDEEMSCIVDSIVSQEQYQQSNDRFYFQLEKNGQGGVLFSMMEHTFGNYVIQKMLEHLKPTYLERLMHVMKVYIPKFKVMQYGKHISSCVLTVCTRNKHKSKICWDIAKLLESSGGNRVSSNNFKNNSNRGRSMSGNNQFAGRGGYNRGRQGQQNQQQMHYNPRQQNQQQQHNGGGGGRGGMNMHQNNINNMQGNGGGQQDKSGYNSKWE